MYSYLEYSWLIFARVVLIETDEKGTLKATEHDKYETIAGSV
jgi:hypothetical protein